MKQVLRILCIPLGFLCAALGIVGMFVPVLPTTPLLLLAGSTKSWKTYVQPFVEKQAIPAATKARILIISGIVMGISAFAVKDIPGINFVVWVILELVMLWLLYLMFIRIPSTSSVPANNSIKQSVLSE